MKVGKVILPVDFVVLNMEEDPDVPLILGRPFLATGEALIDVQSGDLIFRVNGEEMKFSIYCPTQSQEERATCHRVENVEKPVVETQLSPIPTVPIDGNMELPRKDGPKLGQKMKLEGQSKRKAQKKRSTIPHSGQEWVPKCK